jgi:hypothetical protein
MPLHDEVKYDGSVAGASYGYATLWTALVEASDLSAVYEFSILHERSILGLRLLLALQSIPLVFAEVPLCSGDIAGIHARGYSHL